MVNYYNYTSVLNSWLEAAWGGRRIVSATQLRLKAPIANCKQLIEFLVEVSLLKMGLSFTLDSMLLQVGEL